tara:strand:+ start:74 stop:199 length:126 start_codon:yes stop_codon:yes gene_type:complete
MVTKVEKDVAKEKQENHVVEEKREKPKKREEERSVENKYNN